MFPRSEPQWRWLALALGIALLGWLLLRESEPDRAVDCLRCVANALRVERGERAEVRRARIREALGAYAAPDVRVQATDLPPGAPERIAVRIAEGYDEARVEIDQPVVEIDADGRGAWVTARALLWGRSVTSGVVTDAREVRVRLHKRQDTWQMATLEASGPSHVEPEARP